ncbi:hypothetical protein H5V45_18750 [Nocardioides sp. KIGAM211]|uniref:Septum formation-related domain-containing protein n=1 Tax=Nocardioides luti TaxID=2761101 RepID=A0A7X0RJ99_9ACTN|nr:hypothetical protein [Nocardioides luti]MBB6629373.1 hypothetical protein [Nocardioides luti]
MLVRPLVALGAVALAATAWAGMDHRPVGPSAGPAAAASGPCRTLTDPAAAVDLPEGFTDLLRSRAGVVVTAVGRPVARDLDRARERGTMAGYGGDAPFLCRADVTGGDAGVEGRAVMVVREHVDVPGFGPSGAEGSSVSTTCVTFVRPGSGTAYGGALCFGDGSGPTVVAPTEPPEDA